MENKDMPIHPCIMQKVGENSYRLSKPSDPKEWNVPVAGLTKREAFALAAMQGIISQHLPGAYKQGDADYLALQSIMIADALLAELSKPQP